MMFFASTAKADNLTVEQAKAIGAYYMASQTDYDNLTPERLALVYQYENPNLNVASAYVFKVSNGCGWIIIAGSTVVDPIIAFSEEGTIDMNALPDNLNWWLTRYTDVIADIQRLDAENDYPDSKEYSDLLKLKQQGAKGGTKEQKIILMETQWNQGGNYNPTYNYYCPVVNGRYCVTGCVATALAQLCRYYRYPVNPKGVVSTTCNGHQYKLKLDTISFDYSLMPNALTSSSPLNKIQEVAKLNYALGLAVKMDYTPDGSGASMNDALNAMWLRFKYQAGTMRLRYGDTDPEYISTLRRYLMSGDVVAMRGASSTGGGSDAAGHAWVACGYRSEDTTKYWMNWGWGGDGDGWFNVADNNMRISSLGYNFNVDQGCIFGMIPPEDSNIHHSHVAIREVDNTVLGTAYPNPAVLSVQLPYVTEMAADMQVFGIDGKLVATRRVQPGCGEVSLRVDALPKGVYIYRLNSQSGKFIVR